jgi:hypothetical protein
MSNTAISSATGIKKLHVKQTVEFAIHHIPDIDQGTLEKFLELVFATGNFGPISEAEIIEKMNQIMKFIPGACGRSLLTLAELLDIRFPPSGVGQTMPMMITPPQEPRLLSSARAH